MDFQKVFKDALDIVFLKELKMNEVAQDKNALIPALSIVGLVAVVCALGSYVFPMHIGFITYRPDIMFMVEQAVITFVVSVGLLYLMGYLAERFFASKLPMESFVKVMGYGNIVSVLGFISSLSIVSGVWGLVILWTVLTKVAKMEPKNVVILIVIEALVVFGAMGGVYSMMPGML